MRMLAGVYLVGWVFVCVAVAIHWGRSDLRTVLYTFLTAQRRKGCQHSKKPAERRAFAIYPWAFAVTFFCSQWGSDGDDNGGTIRNGENGALPAEQGVGFFQSLSDAVRGEHVEILYHLVRGIGDEDHAGLLHDPV